MQDHLDKFSDWAKTTIWSLTLPNVLIWKFLKFLKNQDEDHALAIDQVPLQGVSTAKILGVHVSSDLKWSNHICEVLKKANSRLYLLKLLKHFNLLTDDLVTIYSWFIRPTVEYAAPVWHPRAYCSWKSCSWTYPEEGMQDHSWQRLPWSSWAL